MVRIPGVARGGGRADSKDAAEACGAPAPLLGGPRLGAHAAAAAAGRLVEASGARLPREDRYGPSEPVAHLESSIFYNKVGRGDVTNFIRQHSNSQAKYLLYGDRWSEYMKSKGLGGDGTLEGNATSALNGVEILGTTEELSTFTERLAKLLEVPVPTLQHVHGNTTHEFELTDEDRSLMYRLSNIDRLVRAILSPSPSPSPSP